MADLEDLRALLGYGQPAPYAQIVESDPYAPLQIIPQSINKAVGAVPEFGTKERLIAGLLSGFLGGLGEGASEDYRNRALGAYEDTVLKSANGLPITQPDILSPSLFAQAQNQGTIFRGTQTPSGPFITDEESQILGQYDDNLSKIRDPRVLDRILRAKQLAGVQKRSDRAFESSEKERSIPGLTKIEGYRPTSKDQDDAVDLIGTRNLLKSNLADLKTSLSEKGQALTGGESIEQLQNIAELLRLQKERFGGGAAYTELEAKLANAVLPKIIADPTVSLFEVFKNVGLGRDPIKAIDNLEKLVEREAKIKLQARKYTLDDLFEAPASKTPTKSVSSSQDMFGSSGMVSPLPKGKPPLPKEEALRRLKERGLIP